MIDPQELRRIALLADLSDKRLEDLAAHGHELALRSGEFLFHQGEEATFLSLLLEGQLETTRLAAGDELPLLHHEAGGFLGAVSLVTGEPYGGSTRAAVDSRLYLVEPEAFRRLLVEEHTVFEHVMKVFVPVIGGMHSIDRDRDKLLALGSLAAGLAHELNNPAAAAQRAASELRTADTDAQSALAALAANGVGPEAIGRLCGFTAEAVAAAGEAEPLDPLDRADREEELRQWLAQRGVADGYDAAGALVDAGLDEGWVERVLDVAPGRPAEVLEWIASRVTAARISRELEDATARISSLVQAVREYSYLDQAPRQEVDVHEGLDSTLAILAHKIAEKHVEVTREYDRSLPRIDAHAPELNQVWTNLLDNAISAVDEGGHVTVRTGRAGEFLTVEVADDGPGVPAEIRERVFDAFYTTKPPGEGTGLGLDIAKRIAVRHHGDLRLEPVERGACFQVLLPLGD